MLVRRGRPGLGLASLLIALLLLSSCAPDAASAPGSAGAAVRETLMVFAASSLTEPFTAIGRQFEAGNPGTRVDFNFGGSNQLRAQLEQGARADVFASANQAEMEKAAQGGLVAGEAAVFARNRLVVIVPADNPAGLTAPIDLARPGLRLVVAAPTVPVGDYTRRALALMNADPAYGTDFAGRVARNLVSEETNVKQVVAKVQLGEVDAGVVYLTDARAVKKERVRTIDIPDRFNQVAEYPLAVVQGAAQPTLAQRFVDYVLSDAGQAILAEAGFTPAR